MRLAFFNWWLLFPWTAIVLLVACSDGETAPSEQPRHYNYPPTAQTSCPSGERPAQVDADAGRAEKPSYRVRTPANYDARFAHPLLVVYAYAGGRAKAVERFTKLTAAATARGLIVAYADHRSMSKSNVESLANVARNVAKHWCIDEQRVFFTGHSDGGTVSTALSLLPESRDSVHAIAVSAAGFRESDLQELHCRAPMPVMIMHGAKDTLFPGWGRETSRWWASCNRCDATPGVSDASGCRAYSGCAKGGAVLYCEGQQSHSEWPELQTRIVDFLLAQSASDTAAEPASVAARGVLRQAPSSAPQASAIK